MTARDRFSIIPAWPVVLSAGVAASLLGYEVRAAAEEVLKLDKVEVTGSHIKRPDIEGPSPVVVLDREDIEQSGAPTLNELFRDVIYTTSGNIDDRFGENFAPGSAAVDLRGFGVTRTLVLVDGRRLPAFPFGQDGGDTFVDINLIPLGAVERVEILKDGASAIYGADAVAGVVNIILRKDYDGAEVSAQYGLSDEGDGEETHVNLAAGAMGERSNVTFALDYFKRQPVWARDRDFSESANGPVDNRSMVGNPGTIFPAAGPPFPDPRCPADQIVGFFCRYDFAPFVPLIPEAERVGLSAAWDQELNETISVFTRATFSHTESERSLAPPGVTGDPSTWLSLDATHPNNPFGQDISVVYRFLELGPRIDESENDAYTALAGVRGAHDSWDWELAAGAGAVDADSAGVSGYSTFAALQAAVDSGDLNPLGDSPDFDPQSVAHVPTRRGESSHYFVDFKANGELTEMRHGTLGMAFGAEHRKEDFSDEWDAVTVTGDVTGVGATSADGDRESDAAYVEFAIPALQDVEIQLAGRYDHYSDFGDTVNPKLGVRWQPRDNLLLRFSTGTGFKAPALHQLYSATTTAFDSVNDPVTGDSNVQVELISGGNPDLDPEESRSYGLGMVWDVTPAWNVIVDYWQIKNEDAIVLNEPQFLVNNEDRFPGTVERNADDDIIRVFAKYQNVSEQRLWGIDLSTTVDWRWARVGDFHVELATAYLGAFEEEPIPGEGAEDLARKEGKPEWRARGTLGWAKAELDASVTANYVGGYGYDSDAVAQPFDEVDPWTTYDSQFNWHPSAIRGATFTLGVENMFDEDPPIDIVAETAWPFINGRLHDPRGRFFYARYRHEF